MPLLFNFKSSRSWGTLSKALARSEKITSVGINKFRDFAQSLLVDNNWILISYNYENRIKHPGHCAFIGPPVYCEVHRNENCKAGGGCTCLRFLIFVFNFSRSPIQSGPSSAGYGNNGYENTGSISKPPAANAGKKDKKVKKKQDEPEKPVGVVYAQVDKSKKTAKPKEPENLYDQAARPNSKVRLHFTNIISRVPEGVTNVILFFFRYLRSVLWNNCIKVVLWSKKSLLFSLWISKRCLRNTPHAKF